MPQVEGIEVLVDGRTYFVDGFMLTDIEWAYALAELPPLPLEHEEDC